ncbi:hypothetical protein [Tenuifilum sp.]|uniref:hypothetical protein n=1 Tax=Tenuifilum sp. TaxID=2760880 RepID=UPI0025843FEA|nr:hypothetical protein [Tenuifilum sp.]
MARLYLLFTFPIILLGCNISKPKKIEQLKIVDSLDKTNNFYDNQPTYDLPLMTLEVNGEVANPGTVDFSKLPIRSVIVKETKLAQNGTDRFTGA